MTPIEKAAAEVVCLVDDDLAVLKSIERLLALDGSQFAPSATRKNSWPRCRRI
jgi:FixJ family two-component response regulator